MPGFTDEQKKIALLLLSEPKTEEELHKQLNLPYDKLGQDLKQMLKLGVVLKEGYPTKYRLRQDIVDELQKRKKISEEDSFKIKIRAIIELKAVEETLLKKHLDKIAEALGKEKNFTIYGITKAEVVEEDEMCSSFLEVTLTVKDFSELIKFTFFYAPTTIEVIKPERIELSQYEFQAGIVELATIFQSYANYFTQKMTKEELNKFYKEIYS